MSGSIRWLMGLLSLYVLLTILGQTLDAQATYIPSGSALHKLKNNTTFTIVQTPSTSGAKSESGSLMPGTIQEWFNMLSWEFSFWYEYDDAGNKIGESPLRIIWWIMFFPLTIGMIILLLLTMRQLVFGA